MRENFEDRLHLLSSTTLEMMARIKERQADELESMGIRSKNNSRVAIKIRLILEQRGYYPRCSPTAKKKKSTTANYTHRRRGS
jgi:hypothetical protein